MSGTERLEKKGDSLQTGLKTDAWWEDELSGYQVTWIEWDSPFRATALEIGDIIVRANGVDYSRANPELKRDTVIGGLMESASWQRAGLSEGSPITLTVRRGPETLELTAPLAVNRARGRPTGGRARGLLRGAEARP